MNINPEVSNNKMALGILTTIVIYIGMYQLLKYLHPWYLTYTNADKDKVEPCRTIVFANVIIFTILILVAYYKYKQMLKQQQGSPY